MCFRGQIGDRYMFEDLIRELRRMERPISVPIDFELDDDRYLDRACPNPECGTAFKVLFEDWRDKVPDEAAYCPICGFTAEPTEWSTPDQKEHIKSVAVRYMHDQVGNALARGARRSNRSSMAGDLISMTWSYRPGRPPVVVTAEASEVMTQRSTCEKCGCRYSSVGAAFFCPACGHNSVVSTFDAAVDAVRKTIAALPEIRQTIARALDKDSAEDSARHVCENGLVKLVSAFQRFAEAQYCALESEDKPSPRRNAFQNLQESSSLWRTGTGCGYDELLSAAEYTTLERFFQQRHLLSHNDGIVDQVYLERSGDLSYAVGQRLVIRGQAVEELARLVSKLAQSLRLALS